MPPYSKSHGTSEGSHFSGRPPPPYALVALTLESYASLVEAAERRTPIDVFEKSHIFRDEGDLEFETTDSLQSTSFQDAASVHSQSARLELDDKLVQLMTYSSNTGESTISSSEDGGVLLPPSSTPESLQSFPNDLIGLEYFKIIRQRKTIFWQDYKHLPSLQIEKLWQEKLSQLMSLVKVWDSQPPSSPPHPRRLRPTFPVALNDIVGRSGSMGVEHLRTKEESVYAARALSGINHREYLDHRRLYERNRNKPQIFPSGIPERFPLRPKIVGPAALSAEQFKRCSEPWALSSIVTWLKVVARDLDNLTSYAVMEAIVALFVYKLPNVRLIDAEALGAQVLTEMIASGSLVIEETIQYASRSTLLLFKFGPGNTTGVIFQLTRGGCYSQTPHCSHKEGRCYHNIGRCYSYHCMKSLDCAQATRTHATSWAEGSSQLRCPREGCESAFRGSWTLLSHIRTVHHVRWLRYPIEGCVWYRTKAILAPEHLQKHLGASHHLAADTSTNLVLDACFAW
jgi:hypothetical protein